MTIRLLPRGELPCDTELQGTIAGLTADIAKGDSHHTTGEPCVYEITDAGRSRVVQ